MAMGRKGARNRAGSLSVRTRSRTIKDGNVKGEPQMLANILAIVVGLSSLYLLSTAFIAADRHRKDDFLWGAVGLFYSLVLWLSAGRLTGAILLGQAAASILVIAFGWQTLKLRQALLYPDQPVQLFSIVDWLQGRLGKVTAAKQPQAPVTPKSKETPKETIRATVPEVVTPIAPDLSEVEDTRETTVATAEEPLPTADIFDDFEDFEDFEIAEDRKAIEAENAEVPPIENDPESADPQTATLEISETVTLTLEIPVEDLPAVEAVLEDLSTETAEESSDHPPHQGGG
jgi:hypothetical protein